MPASLDDLKNVLGLRSGASLERDLPPRDAVSPRAILPWLAPRRVHEFADLSNLAGDWQPPLTLLAGLAAELPFDGSIVWVGRKCWPTFQFFQREGQEAKHLLARHIFLDPLSDAERLWGIAEVARSPAIRAIIADGGGFNATAGRKLQLAAEKGNAVVLLARPASDFSQPSWAATRWCVSPLAADAGKPQWKVSLTRVTGTRQGQDASRHWIVSWTYEVFRGTGAFDLSANVGCGTGAATTEALAAHWQSA